MDASIVDILRGLISNLVAVSKLLNARSSEVAYLLCRTLVLETVDIGWGSSRSIRRAGIANKALVLYFENNRYCCR